MRSRQLEAGTGVVELAIAPLHRVVAGFACGRQCGRDVIDWRHRLRIVRLMTRVARHAGQVVVVVSVTVGTLTRRHGVRAGQRESGAVVVELCVRPRTRVVALIAALREIRRHMVRIRRPLIVLQVTGHAGSGGQVVIVGDVAIGALPWRHGVHAGQRKICQVVVKRGPGP